MVNIFVLYLNRHHLDTPALHYFSSIDNIIEFLNRVDYSRYPSQTVVYTQLDSNVRQPFYIKGYDKPCNTFSIDKNGLMKPMNIHKILCGCNGSSND